MKKVSTTPSHQLEVFYDGDCPLCNREITQLRRWDKQDRILFTNIAASDFEPSPLGKTYDELMAKMHVRLADGAWVVGVEAFRRLYEAVGFKWLTTMSRLPLVSQALNLGYSLFARNRLRLTGRCSAEQCKLSQGNTL